MTRNRLFHWHLNPCGIRYFPCLHNNNWIFRNIDMETNECLHKNGSCWKGANLNIIACKVNAIQLLRLQLQISLQCYSQTDQHHLIVIEFHLT
jgi:hypothetical protein